MSKRPPQSTHDAATAAGFDDREDSALAKESLEEFRLRGLMQELVTVSV